MHGKAKEGQKFVGGKREKRAFKTRQHIHAQTLHDKLESNEEIFMATRPHTTLGQKLRLELLFEEPKLQFWLNLQPKPFKIFPIKSNEEKIVTYLNSLMISCHQLFAGR